MCNRTESIYYYYCLTALYHSQAQCVCCKTICIQSTNVWPPSLQSHHTFRSPPFHSIPSALLSISCHDNGMQRNAIHTHRQQYCAIGLVRIVFSLQMTWWGFFHFSHSFSLPLSSSSPCLCSCHSVQHFLFAAFGVPVTVSYVLRTYDAMWCFVHSKDTLVSCYSRCAATQKWELIKMFAHDTWQWETGKWWRRIGERKHEREAHVKRIKIAFVL